MLRFSRIIMILLLPMVVLLGVFEYAVFDLDYFEAKFIENNTMVETGLELEQLLRVSQQTLDYLKDRTDTLVLYEEIDGEMIQVFEARELAHMEDVKRLFDIGFAIRNISLILLVLFGGWLFINHRRSFWHSMRTGSIFFAALILVIGVYAWIDFDKAFVIFHKLLFTNDLWILDPTEDIMIQMLPIDFFMGIGLKTALLYTGYLILSIFGGTWLKNMNK
ncbi:MAG: TIGR01906 family membrane protein [Tissierellales bacterium]|nr:TIGR01906 family membrane protein [Tissierellales bacterium]MBN2828182.1 TIGR01906 family membrane protein [Tissierellales bacterium]